MKIASLRRNREMRNRNRRECGGIYMLSGGGRNKPHDHLPLSAPPGWHRAGLHENLVTLRKLGKYQARHANITNARLHFFFYISGKMKSHVFSSCKTEK